jgi:hypothetical protein
LGTRGFAVTWTDFCCCSPFTYAVTYSVPELSTGIVHDVPDVLAHAVLSAVGTSGIQRHCSCDMSTAIPLMLAMFIPAANVSGAS